MWSTDFRQSRIAKNASQHGPAARDALRARCLRRAPCKRSTLYSSRFRQSGWAWVPAAGNVEPLASSSQQRKKKMTKNLLSDLKYYSTQLLKESSFLAFFALDVIGLVISYFTNFTVPYWIFVLIFVLALFFGGFNIYRKGTADIRIEISDQPDSILCIHLTKDDLFFDLTVSGYLVNFGLQSGILENIETYLWANNIKDDYALSRIYRYKMFPLHKGKITPQLLHENKYPKLDNLFEFPIALLPGNMEPFTLGLRLRIVTKFTQNKKEAFEDFIEWLDAYELSLCYTVRQNNGSYRRETRLKIPKSILGGLSSSVYD